MQEIHIFVSGKVQGVGFRASIKRHARLHQITGYARNLSDGRVEICAQGKGNQIQQFIHTFKDNPGHALIEAVESSLRPIKEQYRSFEIY